MRILTLMDATHSSTRPANDHSLRSLDCAAAAAHLRAALKRELGLTSREVSVKTERSSTSSCINVVLRDVNARTSDVEQIAERYQDFDRCSETGEIQGGGTRFVSVTRDSDSTRHLISIAAAQLAAATDDAPTAFALSDRIVFSREGRNTFRLWDSRDLPMGDADVTAWRMVQAYLDLSRAEMAVAS